MAKRFTKTDIWNDDWFYELSPEYKLFWFYIKDDCDFAGVWQPKTRAFKSATDLNIDLNKALEYFNFGKQRIRVLDNGRWFLEDFFVFQYGETLNLSNRVHSSILSTWERSNIPLSSIKGLQQIKDQQGEFWNSEEFEVKLRSN